MVKVNLTDPQKRTLALGMLVLAALMLLDTAYQAGMHVTWRRWIPATLAAATASSQPADTQPSTAPATASASTGPATKPTTASKPMRRERPSHPKRRGADKTPPVHAAIVKRNIMAPPKPTGHGMSLTGVLGNVALFKTRKGQVICIEAGKSNQGVKVVSIDGYAVTIEYQDKRETLDLFAGRGRASRPPRRPTTNVTTTSVPTTSVTTTAAVMTGATTTKAASRPVGRTTTGGSKE